MKNLNHNDFLLEENFIRDNFRHFFKYKDLKINLLEYLKKQIISNSDP